MAAPSTEGYAPEWLEVSSPPPFPLPSLTKLQYEKALGQRPTLGHSAEAIIASFNGLGAVLAAQAPPPDPSVTTKDTTASSIPVRIYTPPGAEGQKLPIGVYYHGGGYLVGNLDGEDAWCRVISKGAGCVVVSVDYRLSTTHKLPVMLEDCLAAYHWVFFPFFPFSLLK
jgi:versiconal hemiacetal acetate esterase